MLSHLSKSNEVEKNFTKERIGNKLQACITNITATPNIATTTTTTATNCTNIQNYNANVNVVPEKYWNNCTDNNERKQIGLTAAKATDYNGNNQRSKVC